MITKNKIYISSAVFSLLSLAFVLFLILPALKDIKAFSNDLLAGKNNLLSLTEQVKEMNVFNKNYSDYKSNLEKIDSLFVDAKNPIAFIEFLEKTSADSKIKSDISLTPGTIKEGSANAPSIAFQINCEGNFSDIIKFSEKIENGPYLASIQSLMIRKIETQNQSGGKNPVEPSEKVSAAFSISVLTKKH